jgi:hypothetical protein
MWRKTLVMLASGVGLLVAIAAASAVNDSASAIAPKAYFSYKGHEQSYVVPHGVVMVGVAVEGGQGGQFGDRGGEGGGRDGGVGALLEVAPGQKLFVEVGSAGAYGGGTVFGGGGAAGQPPPVVCKETTGSCADVYASSGGGASDVRTCSMSSGSCPSKVSSAATRLIVGGGGGGQAGSGNGPDVMCAQGSGGGRANNFQNPPGNPGGGPAPIVTSAGIVYPGYPTGDQGSPGITPAAGGGAKAGTGGRQAGCSSGTSINFVDSVAGSASVGPVGGTGGNASSLGPTYTGCSGNSCFDAGPGGGGGGGYFGGGGGATGLDKTTGNCGVCNGAGSGQGGGGGSSFVSKKMQDPTDESLVQQAWNGWAAIVPVLEIDVPANGAVYKPGQIERARWSCAYDGVTGFGSSQGCTATVASGSPIDTKPGRHSFTVTGTETSNGTHTFHATITYTVR